MSNTNIRKVSVDELFDLISDLTDMGDCYYDHHGYCQEHGWFMSGSECPHARARKLWDERGNLAVEVLEAVTTT